MRQKKAYENELDRLAGMRMTLETQVNAIESANMNLETMTAMRKGADALKTIHGSLYVSPLFSRLLTALLTFAVASRNIDKVDSTMDSIREQMDLTNEISDAISNPVGMGQDIDEDELKNELEELEQDELNERLVGADSVPLHTPAIVSSGPSRVSNGPVKKQAVVEDDDDAELRALQAELAM